jgi:hypothetical protein
MFELGLFAILAAGLLVLARIRPRSRILCGIVAVQYAALASMPYERTLATNQFKRGVGQLWAAWNGLRDPAVGTPIQLGRARLTERLASAPAGLIVLSACEGCSARAAAEWAGSLQSRHIAQLYIVSRKQAVGPSRRDLERSCAALKVRPTFVWDQSGTAHRELNAYFVPRCYRLVRGAVLEWLQKPGEPIPPPVRTP